MVLQVASVTPTNVEARLVDDPDAETIFVATFFVAVNRVRPCYSEQTNTLWKGQQKKKRGTISSSLTKVNHIYTVTSTLHNRPCDSMTQAMAQN